MQERSICSPTESTHRISVDPKTEILKESVDRALPARMHFFQVLQLIKQVHGWNNIVLHGPCEQTLSLRNVNLHRA